MNENPLISIIIPIHNVGKYLVESLDSILAQTYTRLEVILVDDASADDSGAICDCYAAKDSRIKVLHKCFGGVSRARNSGLDIATGDFIGYLDSDDVMPPYAIERLLSAFRPDVGIVSGGFDEFDDGTSEYRYSCSLKSDEALVLTPEEAIRQMLLAGKMPRNIWTKLYRREIVGDIRFIEGYDSEDVLYNYDAAVAMQKAGMKYVYLPDIVCHYRIRKSSIMHTDRKIVEIDSVHILKLVCEDCRSRWPDMADRFHYSLLTMNARLNGRLLRLGRKNTDVYRKHHRMLLDTPMREFTRHAASTRERMQVWSYIYMLKRLPWLYRLMVKSEK